MSLVLTTFKTTNVSYFPLVGGKPAWKLDYSGNGYDALLDYLVANCGTLNDPGSNGIVKRTALNVTAAATAGTDYVAPVNAPTAWTAPSSLLNSWANLGSGNATAAYMIDAIGFVHVRGVLSGGTVTNGTALFNLPAGFRPPLNVSVAVINASTNAAFRVDITPGGDLNIYGAGAGCLPDLNFSFSSF